MLKLIFNLIILLSFSTICIADTTGNNPWTFTGWFGGGKYPAIAVDTKNEGRLFLSSDVAGIWRSDDYGEHWYFVNNGLTNLNIRFLVVAPSNSNIIYAGSPAGLMRSENAGLSWKGVPSVNRKLNFGMNTSHPICIDPRDANKIYIGTSSGEVLFSADGGLNWQNLGDISMPFKRETPISALQVASDGKKVFVTSESGFLSFELSTNSWKSLELPPGASGFSDLLINKSGVLFAASERKVAISHDQGRSWEWTDTIPDGEIGRLAIGSDKDGKTLILIGWKKGYHGGVFLSQDLGRTWNNVGRNLKYDLSGNPTRAWMGNFQMPSSVQIDPFDSTKFYYTDTWGVWRSDDNGTSWNEKITVAPNVSGSDLVVTPNGWIYVAAMDQGLLVSKDGGDSFKPVFPNSQLRSGRHDWRVLVTNNESPDTRIVVTDFPWDKQVNQVITRDYDGRLYISELGKPRKNSIWGQGYARALAVNPTNQKELYLGMDGDDGGGLFLSKDAGMTWLKSEGQPGSLRIYNALSVDPSNPDRLFWGACGGNGGIFRSEDKGKTWKHVLSNFGCVFDLTITPNGTIYAAGAAQGPVIYVSDNHGDDWRLLNKFGKDGACEALTFDHRDPQRLFVGVVGWMENPLGGIFRSMDGGKTWETISEGLPKNTGPAAMAIDAKTDSLFILLYAGGVYKRPLGSIYKSQVK